SVVHLHCRGTTLLEAHDIDCLLALSTSQSSMRLAQALLDCPALMCDLPVPVVTRWLLDLLRAFGDVLWWEILAFLNSPAITQPVAVALLATADMNDADEARLVAHLTPRLSTDDPVTTGTLASLRNHPDWQVRAALVAALTESHSLSDDTEEALSRYL